MFGAAAEETVWLRIARRTVGKEEHYTAYSSRDGTTWTRAGTWAHKLGPKARIGLVSMAGAGFTATFDYVRVYGLKD
jgi:arabinan endo-1,5-alpha-L-arabinosidase